MSDELKGDAPSQEVAGPATEKPTSTKRRRGTGNRSPNSKDRDAELEREKRRREVLRLASYGMTFREIGAELGISHETAREDYHRIVKEQTAVTVDSHLARADSALLAAIEAHGRVIARGDDEHGASAQALIKAIALHAKLRGYMAPEKKELSGPGGGPITLAAIEAALAAAKRNDGGSDAQ